MNPILDFLAAAFILSVDEDGDITTVSIGWAWPIVVGLLLSGIILGVAQ